MSHRRPLSLHREPLRDRSRDSVLYPFPVGGIAAWYARVRRTEPKVVQPKREYYALYLCPVCGKSRDRTANHPIEDLVRRCPSCAAKMRHLVRRVKAEATAQGGTE